MNDKIYVGSGKTFGKFSQLSINICISDIPKEHIFKSEKTGKSYVKLNVCAKKNIDQYGNSHYVSVNTWQPNQQQNKPQYKQDNFDKNAKEYETFENNDEVPF